MPLGMNSQERSPMGQAQQKRRAVMIVEDDAELRSLTASLLEDEQLDTSVKARKRRLPSC